MNRSFAASAASLALMMAAPAAATFLPSGVQTDVSDVTISSWGFTQCWSGPYLGTANIAAVLQGCQGDYLMMAGTASGNTSGLWDVAAAADYADVIFATPGVTDRTVSHNANGVEWYFNTSWSWGFAPGGEDVLLNSCDVAAAAGGGLDGSEDQRLCWHAGNGNLNSGWSAGGYGNTYGGDAMRALFVANAGPVEADVPAPAAFGLLGLGLAGLSAARRRKTA